MLLNFLTTLKRKGGIEMRNFNYLILIITLFISGCAVGPDYQRPDIDKPGKFNYLDSLKISDSTAFSTTDTTWWALFNDTTLNGLIKTALKENTQINIAAARVEEFMGRYGVAKSDFYPKVGYDLSATHGQFSAINTGRENNPVKDNFILSLNASYELDIWGKVRRSTESAQADLFASEESRKGIVLLITSQLANSYLDLLTLRKQLEISISTTNLRENTLILFRLRYDKGDVSELEIAQLESDYWYTKAQIPFLEKNIAQLENTISVLVGKNPGLLKSANNLDNLVLPAVPEGIPSQILERRPDIRQAENNLVSANAKIGAIKSLYYPSINLSGALGFASNDLSVLFEPYSVLWNIGAGIVGPLFRGGEISSQVKVAESVKKQLLYAYVQTVRNAFKEVENALIERAKVQEQLVYQQKRVKSLSDYYRLSEMRYNEGVTSYLEVLDAQRSLFSAQLDLAIVQASLYKSVVNIYSALAGSWVDKASMDSVQPNN
jgi:outer membrane protein, multidrug efflux system